MTVSVFFFKQNTAYEMRISDWSSDVCSSDLHSGTKSHGDELRARQSLGHARSGERCRGTHGSKVGPFTQALGREHVYLDRVTLDSHEIKRRRGRDRKSVV